MRLQIEEENTESKIIEISKVDSGCIVSDARGENYLYLGRADRYHIVINLEAGSPEIWTNDNFPVTVVRKVKLVLRKE